jgi:serine/threonine protein kinase
MAPEVMAQNPFDFKADVYSFGLILWELYTQLELFVEYDDWDPFFEAIVFQGKRPEIPASCIPSLASLMQKCWAHEPDERPTFKEVIFRLDEITVDCYLQPGEGKHSIEEARGWWKVTQSKYIYNVILLIATLSTSYSIFA